LLNDINPFLNKHYIQIKKSLKKTGVSFNAGFELIKIKRFFIVSFFL